MHLLLVPASVKAGVRNAPRGPGTPPDRHGDPAMRRICVGILTTSTLGVVLLCGCSRQAPVPSEAPPVARQGSPNQAVAEPVPAGPRPAVIVADQPEAAPTPGAPPPAASQ